MPWISSYIHRSIFLRIYIPYINSSGAKLLFSKQLMCNMRLLYSGYTDIIFVRNASIVLQSGRLVNEASALSDSAQCFLVLRTSCISAWTCILLYNAHANVIWLLVMNCKISLLKFKLIGLLINPKPCYLVTPLSNKLSCIYI